MGTLMGLAGADAKVAQDFSPGGLFDSMMNPQTNEQIDAAYPDDPDQAHGKKMIALNMKRVFMQPDFLYNGAPIRIKGRVVGVLCLFFIGSFPDGAPEEVKLIQKLKANEVGAALANAVANVDDLRVVPSHLAPTSPAADAVKTPNFGDEAAK
mmetsp:Transcript_8519/g.19974  ORF Transcript_8519/g.19974 Transcript_8519/m.19974 type:complete len:153 (-) Transcript_8519:219-677(-)